MFSKEDSKRLRQDFWVSFGKSYPNKWILYNTRIKGLSLKFHFELKRAMVSIDIEHSDLATRIHLWEKLISLKPILTDEYLPDVIFNDALILDNNKEISRIFVEKHNVSIHNKNSWQETMIFLNETMNKFEAFFMEYKDFIEP